MPTSVDIRLPRLRDRDNSVPWAKQLVDDLDRILRQIGTTANTGGGSGSVTSVAGGVGITNTPEPIVGVGTVDLDVNSLTAIGAALAGGDLFPVVDVSVGTAPAAQRKATLTDIATFVGAGTVTGSGTLNELAYWSAATALTSNSDIKRVAITGGTSLVVHREVKTVGDGTDSNVINDAYGLVDPQWLSRRSRGTEGLPTGVKLNDRLMHIRGSGHDGTIAAQTGAFMDILAAEDWTNVAHGTRLTWWTTSTATTTNTERMRLEPSGELMMLSGATRQLVLNNGSGGRSSFVDSAHAANLDYALPTAHVTNGLLLNNGAGVLSWSTATPPVLPTALAVTITTGTQVFTTFITDAAVSSTSKILVYPGANELDPLSFNVSPTTGGFMLEINAVDGARHGNLKGIFNLAYMVY